ncbi:hypothetical protein [Halalkalibacterium ligniniphilum]|nr:hypothetical protein [Halalkalibacterium ligniniphilum]
MDVQCFYCSERIEEKNQFVASFFLQQEHVDKPLCEECYKEWLEGMKE